MATVKCRHVLIQSDDFNLYMHVNVLGMYYVWLHVLTNPIRAEIQLMHKPPFGWLLMYSTKRAAYTSVESLPLTGIVMILPEGCYT